MCGCCEDCMFEVINNGIKTGEMHIMSASSLENWHEIHITFEADQKEMDAITAALKQIKVKVISVKSYSADKYLHTHTMTSVKIKGSCNSVLENTRCIKKVIKNNGGKILRTKIETTPWNAEITNFKNTYLESHIEVFLNDDVEENLLYDIAHKHNGYISKNINKEDVLMLTIRQDIGLHSFNRRIDNIIDYIAKYHSFKTGRKIIERTWHDDNRNLDAEWVNIT